MRVLQLTYRATSLCALTSLALLASSGVVWAQAPSAEPAPAPSAEPPVIQPLPPAPPPAPSIAEVPPPAPLAPLPPVEEAKPAAEGLHLSAFVDANYSFQTQAQGTPSPFHRAYAFNNFSTDAGAGLAQNGFQLSFAGIDASYDAGQLGATISLRAGPSVLIFYGKDAGQFGLDNITQAYATWTPTPVLSIDFGQFNTIFGAEVAESWQNLNYTRGALYYAMQPFWHTGVRATVTPSEQVAITGMVVNGVNSAHDDNESPSLALQLSLTPNEMFSMALGGYFTLQPSSDTGQFDNFFDLVASLTVDRFSLVLNADLDVNANQVNEGPGYVQTLDHPMFWGVSLAAGYQATELFGMALRGEYLSDSDNQLYKVTREEGGVTYPHTQETNVLTVTGTLDFKPVKGSNNLIIRWDNRIEMSNEDIFYNHSEEPSDAWFGTTLGVVVTTDS